MAIVAWVAAQVMMAGNKVEKDEPRQADVVAGLAGEAGAGVGQRARGGVRLAGRARGSVMGSVGRGGWGGGSVA